MKTFEERLREAIQVKDLDVEPAVQLSKELHEAEQCGYKLSMLEDALWSTLTRRIQKARESA